jgi:hypothetical protein
MSLAQFPGAAAAHRLAPPVEVTKRVYRVLPVRTPRGPALRRRGIALHLVFGTAAGGVYGYFAPPRYYESTAIGYAALIYTASYLGVLPALSLHPAAHRDRTARQVANAVGHFIYGMTLAEVMRLHRQGVVRDRSPHGGEIAGASARLDAVSPK